jgi:hypothetical protein
MSIEQPLDPQLIEQTKQQIRSLVGEIAQLAKTNVSPEEFYGQFLPRVVSALAAVGGAVWTMNPEGQLALQYQINIQETHLRENEEQQAQHSRLLYKTLSGGEAILVPSHSGPGDADDASRAAGDGVPAANPTDFLLLLGILKTDLETMGLVEIFQRSDSSPTTQQGYLRFLVQMCELAGDFLKSHQLRHFSDRQTLWTQLEDFTRSVHISLDPRETAYTIANEGRRLIECDRVSVAIRKGKKCHIEAISGQDLFDKRSNVVRLLGRLATAVVAGGDPVWYTGDTRDLAPQVEDAVQEYVDEAHSKTVAILPLRRPPPPEDDDPKKRSVPGPPIGALIVEQIEDSRVTGSLTHRSDVVCKHSSTALANALEHQNLFLMPVWRALGKTRWVLEARTLPKTLSIAGGVVLVLLIFGLWPASFTMESKGALEPVERRRVFAETEGSVEEICDKPDAAGRDALLALQITIAACGLPVEEAAAASTAVQASVPNKKIDHGTVVAGGELLLRLRSREVKLALAEVDGQRRATAEQLWSVMREMQAGKSLKLEERMRLAGQQAELKEKLAALEAQWTLYKAKERDLEIRSPIDGVIVTWHLRELLGSDRPVQRGQELMRVANPDGPWQLELQMPENRMGHITRYAQEHPDEPLEVVYILATEAGTKYHGTVTEIHTSAEIRGDEGNTVLMRVALDPDEMQRLRQHSELRPGAAVTAKVYCGRRPLGYVLLHDVIEFIQARVLFRFF